MWHLVRYPLVYGFFINYIEGCAIDEHNKYMKEQHGYDPIESELVTKATIDPGGMMRMDGPKTELLMPNDFKFEINNEHILIASNFYFNEECFEEACLIYGGAKPIYNMTIELLTESIVQVYLPYSVLVMSVDSYMHLCKEFSKLLVSGMGAYMDLMSALPSEHFAHALSDLISSKKVGEA